MSVKQRFLLWVVALLLIGEPLLAQEPKVLGVPTELTGEGSTFGHDIKDVLTFANEKLANGRYKLDFQDTRCDAKTGVSVAKYFTEVSRPAALIGYGCSGPTLASAPILEKSKMLTMVTVASSPSIASAGDYIFRTCPNDRESGRKLAEWVGRSGVENLAVLSAVADYTQDLRDSFLQSLNKKAIAVDYLPETTDFKPFLLKLRKDKIDALFLNAQFEGSLELMLKDLQTLGWKPRLFAAYYPSSPVLLNKSASLMEGIEFVDMPAVSDLLGREGADLYREYTNRFGPMRSYDATFATIFEGFRALHVALESGQDPKEYLRNRTFDGIFGPYSFDSQGEIQGFGFVIKRMEGGVRKTIVK